LDKYTLKLSAWLKTEAAKSRKQRRTLKQLHLELRALGYEGSYDQVAAFARRWKVDQLERVNSASKSTLAELAPETRRRGSLAPYSVPRFFLVPESQHIHGIGSRFVTVQGDIARIPKHNHQLGKFGAWPADIRCRSFAQKSTTTRAPA